MKKITLSLLMSACMTTALADHNVQAYTTGPYFNLTAGGITFTIPDFFDDSDYHVTSLAAKAGLGFIHPINSSQNPFFVGLEGNIGYYSITKSDIHLYGGDLAAILGKQLNQQTGMYVRLGANALGESGHYVFGPQVGAGLGYQISPRIRLTGEINYAVDTLMGVTTYTLGLQTAL